METWKPPTSGPIDDTNWAPTLAARAIDRGTDDDRLHGYAVLGDLARHYQYGDVLYLAITGELPSERASVLFDLALVAFGSIAVNEAPSHVGVISRICGGTIASALGAGMISVADQARMKVDANAAVVAWLADPAQPLPGSACDPSNAAWIGELLDAAQRLGHKAQRVRNEMSRDAAVIALLFDAGVTQTEQMQAAMIASRMYGLVAEVMATSPQHLREYPAKLPPFHYVERLP